MVPLLGNRLYHGTSLCRTSWGGRLHVSPQYEVDRPSHYWRIATFNWIHCVTLTFDLLTLESRHVMPLWWSIPVPSLICIRLTVPEPWRMTITIFHWLPAKSPNFHVFGSKGGQIANFIFLTPKGTSLAGTTYNDVLCVGMYPKMRPVGRAWWRKGKKTETFTRQTGYLPRRVSE